MDRSQFPILLVEDNEDDVLLIRRAFRRTNLLNPLHAVEHGDAAVAWLSGTGEHADRTRFPLPTLMLLDINLPRRSGLEVLEWLRHQPELRRIPVVVLTSSGERSDVNRAYELGARGYLVKPVRFEGLLEMVKTLGLYWLVMSELPDAGNPPP